MRIRSVILSSSLVVSLSLLTACGSSDSSAQPVTGWGTDGSSSQQTVSESGFPKPSQSAENSSITGSPKNLDINSIRTLEAFADENLLIAQSVMGSDKVIVLAVEIDDTTRNVEGVESASILYFAPKDEAPEDEVISSRLMTVRVLNGVDSLENGEKNFLQLNYEVIRRGNNYVSMKNETIVEGVPVSGYMVLFYSDSGQLWCVESLDSELDALNMMKALSSEGGSSQAPTSSATG